MIEWIAYASPLVLGLGAAANAVTNWLTSKWRLELSEEQARENREFQEAIARRTSELRKDEMQWARMLDRYPLVNGPGNLRRALDAYYGDASRIPPLVLISRPKIQTLHDSVWANAAEDAEAFLSRFHKDRRIHLVPGALRFPLHWVDMDVYSLDLKDVPTIIVQLEAGVGRLHVYVGECHLFRDTAPPFSWVDRAITVKYIEAEKWRRLIEQGGPASPGSSITDVVVPMLEGSASPSELHSQMIEVAALLIKAVVVKAMDCHHLGRETRYHEGFDSVLDEVLRRVPGGEIGRALPQPDLGEVPLALNGYVKDPAMHLLHQAIRRARLGEEQLAEHLLESAIARLGPSIGGPRATSAATVLRRWAREPREAIAGQEYLEKLNDGLGRLPDGSALKRTYLPMVDDCHRAINQGIRGGTILRDPEGYIWTP
jgi:hypothetical protein